MYYTIYGNNFKSLEQTTRKNTYVFQLLLKDKFHNRFLIFFLVLILKLCTAAHTTVDVPLNSLCCHNPF